jgi:hypothetical protein
VSEEMYFCIRGVGGWASPRAGLDIAKSRRESLSLVGVESRPSCSPYAVTSLLIDFAGTCLLY